ncbi:MAG: alpha-2-macroglobulin family protein [Polyangia bacterium]
MSSQRPKPESSAAAPLRILGYGPQGRTDSHAMIFVRFNQPVAPSDAEHNPTLLIEPSVPGKTYFANPDLLVFEPSQPLPLARRFSVLLRGRIDSYDGASHSEPLSWSFETSPPQVRFFLLPRRSPDDPQPRTDPVLLAVDQPTTVEELSSHIVANAVPLSGAVRPSRTLTVVLQRASDADRKRFEVPDKEVSSDRLYAVVPTGGWPSGSQVTLTVSKGLRGLQGPLPTDSQNAVRFQTPQLLSVEQVTCLAKTPCTVEPVTLKFSAPVTKQQTRYIRVTPPPGAYSTELLFPDGEGTSAQVVLHGRFRPDVQYRIDVGAELTDRHHQRLGKVVSLRPVFARAPMLRWASSGGTLPASGKLTVGIESRFVRGVSVRAVVLEPETLVGLSGKSGSDVTWPSRERMSRLNWPDASVGQKRKQLTLVPTGPTAWSSAEIDLRELLGDVRGAVLLEAKVTELTPGGGDKLPPSVLMLVRVTDLAPVLLTGASRSLLYLTKLSSGQPVSGAEVHQYSPGREPLLLGKTDASGLLSLPGVFEWAERSPAALLSASDAASKDRVYLPPDGRISSEQKIAAPGLTPGEEVRALVLSERRTYGPDDIIRVLGMTLVDTSAYKSGTRLLPEGTPVQIELVDEFRQTVILAESKTTREGKFFAELKVPPGTPIGSYSIVAQVLGEMAQSRVFIEETRRPEFSVAAMPIPGDVIAGTRPTIRVTADYSYGGLVRIRKAAYQQRCHAVRFRPPGLPSTWDVGSRPPAELGERGTTGFVDVPLSSGDRPPPIGILEFAPPSGHAIPEFASRCQVAATISDDAFQRSGAQTEYMVHPARYYLATQTPTKQARTGDVVKLPVRALYYDGSRLSAPGVRVIIERRASVPVYRSENGVEVLVRHEQRREPVHSCSLDVPNSGPDPECVFTANVVGDYDVTLRGANGVDTVHSVTRTGFSVLPSGSALPPIAQKAVLDKLYIETGQETLKHHSTLHVTVRGPKSIERGLLLAERNGLREHVLLSFRDGVAQHEFATDDTWVAGVRLRALAVFGDKLAPPVLLEAVASVRGEIDTLRLRVNIDAPKEAGPRAQVPITVRVTNRALGTPIQNARVSLWAVDEAAMDFTQAMVTPDRMSQGFVTHFLPRQRIETSRRDTFSTLIRPYVRQASEPWQPGRSDAEDSVAGSSGSPQVSKESSDVKPVALDARNDIMATPLFIADLPTGPDGKVTATLPLPDSLTTFRIFAVVMASMSDRTSPGSFGASDARVRVSAPMVLRAAIPRLLRPGDRAEVTAMVQNHTNMRGNLQVTARLKFDGLLPPLTLVSSPTFEQSMDRNVPAKIPIEVQGNHAGTAEIELAATFVPTSRTAKKDTFTDLVRLPIVVEQERTQVERAVRYGVLSESDAVAIPLQVPTTALPAPGGLTVSLGASGLIQVEDAARQLVNSPHRSLEIVASRLIPAVLAPELFKGSGAIAFDVKNVVQQSVQRLLSVQLYHGGFAFWPDDQRAHPFGSAYATWMLYLASQGGHPVPSDALQRASAYLVRLLANPPSGGDAQLLEATTTSQAIVLARKEADQPGSTVVPLSFDYFDSTQRAMVAFVLAEMGQPQQLAHNALFGNRAQLPLFARALLLLALHRTAPEDLRIATLTEELLSSISVSERSAHVAEQLPYNLDALFHSTVRTQAAVLMAILRVQPKNPNLLKLTRGLLIDRVQGTWKSTQDSAWALLALNDYNRLHPVEGSDLTAGAWLIDEPLLSAKIPSAATPPQRVEWSLQKLLTLLPPQSDEPQKSLYELPLILQRSGRGTMHYRVGLEWTTPKTLVGAYSQGIKFTRSLRTAAGLLAQSGSLLAGEAVVMDIDLSCQQPVHHLVLDIPLPAGLEAVQREGAAAGSSLSGPRSRLISFEEIRRDRVLIYMDALPAGHHEHTLSLRSTTAGRYMVPPAKATALYEPGLQGSTDGLNIWVH